MSKGFLDGDLLEQQMARATRAGVLVEEHRYDPASKKMLVRTTQDVEPILEANKKLYNEDDRGWSKSKEWRRAASIPNVIVMKWMLEEGINIFKREHWPRVARKLNDPEWRHLRTAPGRLSTRTDRRS